MARPVLPEGYTAEFTHLRRMTMEDSVGNPILLDGLWNPRYLREQKGDGAALAVLPTGGATYCRIFAEGSKFAVVEATAECHVRDNYNKKIGRDIALGRALKNLPPAMVPVELPESELGIDPDQDGMIAS